jgi:hypothetical protein
MSDITKHLREILRLAGEATPGRWEQSLNVPNDKMLEVRQHGDWRHHVFCQKEADAAYIAAVSPEVVAALAALAAAREDDDE